MSNQRDDMPQDPREKACQICNNSDYTWGQAVIGNQSDENKLRIFFRPFDSDFEDGDMSLFIRQCNICGNVLFFNSDV